MEVPINSNNSNNASATQINFQKSNSEKINSLRHNVSYQKLGFHRDKPLENIEQKNLHPPKNSDKSFQVSKIEHTKENPRIPLETHNNQFTFIRAYPKAKHEDPKEVKTQKKEYLEYVFAKSDKFNQILDNISKKTSRQALNIIMKKGSTATAPIQYFKNKTFYAISKTVAEGHVGIKRKMEKWLKASSFAQKHLGMRRPTTLLPGGIAEAKGFGESLAYQRSKFNSQMTGEAVSVPETHFVKIDSSETLQRSSGKGFKTLKEDMELGLPFVYTDKAHKSFLRCVVESYVNGGLDCHLGNIMCKRNEKGVIVDFKLIDNGNSFFVKFPSKEDKLILENYCGWKDYPLSQNDLPIDFKNEILNTDYCNEVENIRFLLQQEKANQGICMDPRAGFEGKDFANTYYGDQMLICDALRHGVVEKITHQGNASAAELAKIQTEEETWKCLTDIDLPDLPDPKDPNYTEKKNKYDEEKSKFDEKKNNILDEIKGNIETLREELRVKSKEEEEKRFALEME